MGKCYIAGAVDDNPNAEKEFSEAAEMLKKTGYRVYNPVELISTIGFRCAPRSEIMMLLFSIIIDNLPDMYMLPGWERSRGAKAEHTIAVELGLKIIYGEKTS
jgi:hypothetical protein